MTVLDALETGGVRAVGGVPDRTIGFIPDDAAVDVREIDDQYWRLLSAFEYQAIHERYTVPADERTDFASVPRPFVWFIPTYGRYTKAAILHDFLCRLSQDGKFSRREADGVFRQAMRLLGVAFLRRWIMWTGVRWGALATADGRKDWLKDVWLVVPISLLVLPFLLPSAVSIVVTLVAWHVVELLAWIPLEVACRVRTRRGQVTKKVNRPQLTFRL